MYFVFKRTRTQILYLTIYPGTWSDMRAEAWLMSEESAKELARRYKCLYGSE